jgi:Fe-S-cluster-containing dehydrogenase component
MTVIDKWNMIVDVARCENCHNCTLSLKDEHVGNDFPGYAAPQPLHGDDWIKITRKVRGSGSLVDVAYLPTMCNHCDDAPCIKAAGDDSIKKRPDGIVIIDPVKAKGRRDLVGACPYGAISWNEELQLPQAWIFDAHLLDNAGFKEPRASQACPTGALRALKLSDEARDAMLRSEGLEALNPALNTKPRVFYKNLYRFTHCFVGGSVLAAVDGVDECVEGAQATLTAPDGKRLTAKTDAFGEFKIDHLEAGTVGCQLSIAHPEFGAITQSVDVNESLNLGDIRLPGKAA